MILITKYALWVMIGAMAVAGFCLATALYNFRQHGSKALTGWDTMMALLGAGIVVWNLLYFTT